jgi:hypothetical protein
VRIERDGFASAKGGECRVLLEGDKLLREDEMRGHGLGAVLILLKVCFYNPWKAKKAIIFIHHAWDLPSIKNAFFALATFRL